MADRKEHGKPVMVLGGSGMLGRHVVRLAREAGAAVDAPNREALDLFQVEGLAARIVDRFRSFAVGLGEDPGADPGEGEAPSRGFIVNASAFTDVAGAEDPERRAEVDALNRDAVREIGRAASTLGLPLAHVSTDYVFSGTLDRPYREEDAVGAMQVYGQSKLDGELALREVCPDALIVRTSTLYGPGERERPHFVDAILAQARKGNDLSVVDPPISSPTYAPDLAEAILDLLEAGATGVVHVANEGSCTRFQLAEEAVRFSGRLGTVQVAHRPDPVGGLARPAYSVLDTARFREIVGRPMRSWQAALRDYVEMTEKEFAASKTEAWRH